jgi:hypothetical protein
MDRAESMEKTQSVEMGRPHGFRLEAGIPKGFFEIIIKEVST